MKSSFALAFAAVLLATPAAAAVTQVFAPGDLPGTLTVEDFEDGVYVPGFSVTASGGVIEQASAGGYASGGTPSGSFGISSSQVMSSLIFDFSGPVRAGGLWFGNDDTCCASTTTGLLQIYSASGLEGTVSLVANMNDFADQFLGFSTDFDVTQIVFNFDPGSTDLFRYVDDLTFGPGGAVVGGGVPEPATWALLIGGFGMAGGMLRRRRALA